MRKRYVVASVFVLTLVTAACGGGDEEPGAPPPAASPTETATGGATTRVAMEDFRFVPADITVAAGAELELDNEGNASHTFTVQGEEIDVEIVPGQGGPVTIDLAAGDYEVICRFHQGQGMVATMTVTG